MKHKKLLIGILAALAVLRALYIIYCPFDVSPDEAHYWEWSRRLDLSYYSKGPAVAYVIALFTSILGNTEAGIRIGAVFFSTAAAYLIYLFGKDLFGCEKVGFYGALVPVIAPIFAIGSILMTTDVMFVSFWIASVYSVKKALDTKSGLWWYSAGLLIGLGFLSKYTMVLLYPFIAVFLISSKEHRFWFLKPQPYVAGALSLIAAAPVIFWNIAHGQVTIKHTMGQAHVGAAGFSFGPFFEFLGAQAGLLTPIIFLGLLYGMWRCAYTGFKENNSDLKLVFFTSAPLFLFFLFKSLHGKVQANWAIAAYVTAMPASVWAYYGLYERLGAAGKKALKAVTAFGLILGIAASFVVYFPMALEPLGAKKILWGPPYNRVTGWAQLGDKVSAVKDELGKDTFVMSDTYQITSELALYTKGNPIAYNADTGGRRMNQYDLWPGPDGLKGYNAVYVKGGNADAEAAVSVGFSECRKELFTVYYKGKSLKEFSIFRCYGFKGMKSVNADKRY